MSHRTIAAAAFGAAVLAIFTVASFAPAAGAEGLAKGSCLLSLQLAQGDADLATPEVFSSGYITAYDHPEWGGQLQFQRLMGDNWALALSAGIGTASETDKPGTNSTPGDPDLKYTQSSWNARVGADYFVHISEAFHLFVGPGFQYWSGHAKFEATGPSVESENANRIAIDGRMGAHVALSNSVGLIGHIGHYWGHVSASDTGADASWSASGNDGAMGFALKF